MDDLPGRARPDLARSWNVEVERVVPRERAVLSFGRRAGLPVVLKVTSSEGEEAREGEVLAAFAGRGAVRVIAHVPGAVLMERACPGGALLDLVPEDRDDEATAILARTLGSICPEAAPPGLPTVESLGVDLASEGSVPADLLCAARGLHAELCASQDEVRLLHGDLHQENLLFDRARGWLAVDPKGIVGELAYEAGAFLRNPWGRPDLFADPVRLRARLAILERTLPLDPARVRSWAFVQAVLAAVWAAEDGLSGAEIEGCLALARLLRETP